LECGKGTLAFQFLVYGLAEGKFHPHIIDGFESSYDASTAGEGSYNSDVSYDKEIGRMTYLGGIQFFDGKIDDVKIFERVLSEAEIAQLASDF